MVQYQVAVVVGSLREESLNRKLATALVKLAPSDFAFRQLQIGDLPLYNQDDEAHPAESVTRFRTELSAVDGFLFVTPEYNRSIPGCSRTPSISRPALTERARGLASRRR